MCNALARDALLQSLGIFVMTVGTMLAGWGDLNFHFTSYAFGSKLLLCFASFSNRYSLAMGSCVLHAAYVHHNMMMRANAIVNLGVKPERRRCTPQQSFLRARPSAQHHNRFSVMNIPHRAGTSYA